MRSFLFACSLSTPKHHKAVGVWDGAHTCFIGLILFTLTNSPSIDLLSILSFYIQVFQCSCQFSDQLWKVVWKVRITLKNDVFFLKKKWCVHKIFLLFHFLDWLTKSFLRFINAAFITSYFHYKLLINDIWTCDVFPSGACLMFHALFLQVYFSGMWYVIDSLCRIARLHVKINGLNLLILIFRSDN